MERYIMMVCKHGYIVAEWHEAIQMYANIAEFYSSHAASRYLASLRNIDIQV